MRRRSFLSSSLFMGAAMIGGDHGHASTGNSQEVQIAPLMAECAKRFLAGLDAGQRARATFAFEADERKNWHFIPKDRKGVALREMSPYQRHLASALLAAGLSQKGYIKAVTIMSLEQVLKIIENDNGETRNPENYYFSIFGTPSSTGTWGYRVEGHHFSQNYTVVHGNVIDGPSFFGANPAEVLEGPRKGLRTLAGEDIFGMELMGVLDDEQRKTAIVNASAYSDILTGASRKAALQGQPSGLSADKMNRRQFDTLMALIEEYARNVPEELAQKRMAQINKAGRNMYFAWSGGVNHGQPHYYRVQTASFLIELDNTQDDANHIHSVWRDLGGDFGQDLLAEHYVASHWAEAKATSIGVKGPLPPGPHDREVV